MQVLLIQHLKSSKNLDSATFSVSIHLYGLHPERAVHCKDQAKATGKKGSNGRHVKSHD